MDAELLGQARLLLDLCRARRLTIATAESCTGGAVAAALTDVAGSSDVFERGFVTYSNEAKEAMLDVPASTIGSYGAVSRETAEAMARGALARARGSSSMPSASSAMSDERKSAGRRSSRRLPC